MVFVGRSESSITPCLLNTHLFRIAQAQGLVVAAVRAACSRPLLAEHRSRAAREVLREARTDADIQLPSIRFMVGMDWIITSRSSSWLRSSVRTPSVVEATNTALSHVTETSTGLCSPSAAPRGSDHSAAWQLQLSSHRRFGSAAQPLCLSSEAQLNVWGAEKIPCSTSFAQGPGPSAFEGGGGWNAAGRLL